MDNSIIPISHTKKLGLTETMLPRKIEILPVTMHLSSGSWILNSDLKQKDHFLTPVGLAVGWVWVLP